jgi:hypothetical protein
MLDQVDNDAIRLINKQMGSSGMRMVKEMRMMREMMTGI